MARNGIQIRGIHGLCEYLANPACRLKELDISFNNLPSRAVIDLASALSKRVYHPEDFNCLLNNFQYSSLVESPRPFESELQILKLNSCHISDLSAAALTVVASMMPQLTRLELGDNFLSQESLKYLSVLTRS